MSIGFDAIGRWATVQEGTGPFVYEGVFAPAGTGVFLPKLNAFIGGVLAGSGSGSAAFIGRMNAASTLGAAGVGGTAIVLHSFDGAVFGTAGVAGGSLLGTALFPAVMHAAGQGALQGQLYAFFVDAEIACVHEETRVFHTDFQDRIAIIGAEDRVYEVDHSLNGANTPNRKRVC